MSRFIKLQAFDKEIIVKQEEMVTVTYQKGWGGELYKLYLTDGREHVLNVECGKKLWNDMCQKADKTYLK